MYKGHYTTSKANKGLLEIINNQISAVINEPWGIVKDAVNADISFLPIPAPEGYINAETGDTFAQADMLIGVDLTDVTIMDFDINWLPQREGE